MTTTTEAAQNPLSTLNLAVIGVATIAALLFQFLLATRRRTVVTAMADEAAWEDDSDPEIIGVDQPEPLRKAS